MTHPSQDESDRYPPLRRPVLFYTAVCIAFGFLGAAVLALLL